MSPCSASQHTSRWVVTQHTDQFTQQTHQCAVIWHLRISTESKKLQKTLKSSEWDDGNKLPLPAVPRPGENLDVLAGEIVKQNKLNPVKMDAVRDVLIGLRMKREEQDGNKVEEARQRGTEIRFGSAIILVHESTGLFSHPHGEYTRTQKFPHTHAHTHSHTHIHEWMSTTWII